MQVIKTFGDKGKMMIGHCAGAMMFDFTGITKGKKVAVHPLAKPAIQNGTATDKKSEIDGNFFTAQDENTIWTMMPPSCEGAKLLIYQARCVFVDTKTHLAINFYKRKYINY